MLFLALSLAAVIGGTTALPAAKAPKAPAAPKPKVDIIAYYAGDATGFKQYPTEKLTHIIYSFLHLKGATFAFDKPQDQATVAALVALKAKHPQLKVMLSLGGWTGCETCSQVFSTEQGRTEFAASVKQVLVATHTDGIDLDWEYPPSRARPPTALRPKTATISRCWCRLCAPPWAALTR
jgi:chitinase